MEQAQDPFTRFVEVIRALRHPVTGCPWDLEQTHLTLRPYLVEETYEVLEAIEQADDAEFRDELGDLLLQVVLHAQLASERKAFVIDDVIRAVTDKMIRRHPHVFGDATVEGSQGVLKNWEAIKLQERGKKAENKPVSALDGVPSALPALIRAQRIGEKATRVGFDWESPEQVWAKVQEELGELQAEYKKIPTAVTQPQTTAPKDRDPELQRALEHEVGDLLFSVCQFARWVGVSAEDSLRGTIERFLQRFHSMEATTEKPLREQSPAELDRLWEQAKESLRK